MKQNRVRRHSESVRASVTLQLLPWKLGPRWLMTVQEEHIPKKIHMQLWYPRCSVLHKDKILRITLLPPSQSCVKNRLNPVFRIGSLATLIRFFMELDQKLYSFKNICIPFFVPFFNAGTCFQELSPVMNLT